MTAGALALSGCSFRWSTGEEAAISCPSRAASAAAAPILIDGSFEEVEVCAGARILFAGDPKTMTFQSLDPEVVSVDKKPKKFKGRQYAGSATALSPGWTEIAATEKPSRGVTIGSSVFIQVLPAGTAGSEQQ